MSRGCPPVSGLDLERSMKDSFIGINDGIEELTLTLLTLMGRLYRRRYQLVFFKTSAKDIKNTPSILVVQISVIHQLKL